MLILHVVETYRKFICIALITPLSPLDALKHHSTSLKTNLIFLQLGVLK